MITKSVATSGASVGPPRDEGAHAMAWRPT
jgi:hypothetical protein